MAYFPCDLLVFGTGSISTIFLKNFIHLLDIYPYACFDRTTVSEAMFLQDRIYLDQIVQFDPGWKDI